MDWLLQSGQEGSSSLSLPHPRAAGPSDRQILVRHAHQHHGEAPLMRAVQLYEKHLLPLPEQQQPVDDVQTDRRGEEERPAMGVTVDALVRTEIDRPFSQIVVMVRAMGRGGLVES